MGCMSLPIFSQILFIAKLLIYSLIISAVIKYLVPNWSLLSGLTSDVINAIAFSAITFPVAMFAFVLWLKR
jgi:hypothetical protein